MNFNEHLKLRGQHAFLSASKYHWINYDDDKLISSFRKAEAVKRGTELHELAEGLIRNGIKLPRTNKTLNMYVNDAINYKMKPEVILRYSDNCFGTADAISFKNDVLRIHDLKTGETPAHIEQLEVYAALFCLEYDIPPGAIDIQLRIYQSDEALCHSPVADEIGPIMDKIIRFDKLISNLKTEEEI